MVSVFRGFGHLVHGCLVILSLLVELGLGSLDLCKKRDFGLAWAWEFGSLQIQKQLYGSGIWREIRGRKGGWGKGRGTRVEG